MMRRVWRRNAMIALIALVSLKRCEVTRPTDVAQLGTVLQRTPR